MNTTRPPYEVQKHNFDAARPYAVVRTFRSFNQIVQRYESEDAARRRALDMIRKFELDTYRGR